MNMRRRNKGNLLIFILFILALVYQCKNIQYAHGKTLYQSYCSNCHMDDGEGLKGLIPPLTDNEYLISRADIIPCSIKYGTEDTLFIGGSEYNERMPPLLKLTDTQITAIMNYIYRDMNSLDKVFSQIEIRQALNNCRSETKE